MSEAALVELVGVDVVSEDDPDRLLVRDVTWGIDAGEWWAVGGGPASGKTALLSVAAGLNPAARGVVRLFGRELAAASESEQTAGRREIGFVFENGGGLLGRLSVAENVALPLRYHSNLDPTDVRSRVEALLGLAGLERFADWMPSRLTLALRQRVALLRSIAAPVRVLFLDSPLRSLAPSGIRWWLGFLRELRARRIADGEPLSLITSAYDFHALRDDAGRFAVLENGCFRVLDEADEVAGYREDTAPPGPTADGL
jgi:phospholipid/cholesterol/gamma-HCH transport system ATP-binding protein